jgi:hypothetical protein
MVQSPALFKCHLRFGCELRDLSYDLALGSIEHLLRWSPAKTSPPPDVLLHGGQLYYVATAANSARSATTKCGCAQFEEFSEAFEKFSKSCRKAVEKFSKSFQKTSKKFPKSFQKVSKKLTKSFRIFGDFFCDFLTIFDDFFRDFLANFCWFFGRIFGGRISTKF